MTKISKYYQRKYGLQEEVPAADLASSGSGEVKLSKYYQRKYGLLGNSEQVENRDWAEGKPEQPTVTQPRFTWDVPADAATIDKRFQAVSPAQFQQNQQLLRKYGGNYENYLNDNRRNFSSAAEYEQTVARARQYNSSVQLQSAQTRVANAEKAAQDVAVEAERIQRSAENLQGLYDRYQQTGDVTDGQTYLLAAQAHKQALEAYQEKYKAYEKEWDDAYKAYDTARSRAEKDQAAYLKASERYQQEIAAIQSRASKPGNLPEGRSTGTWSSGPVEFLDKTFTATRAGQMDWISGMAELDRKAGNAMLRLGASILVDVSKLTGNQKLRETADAWWEKSYSVSEDAMAAKEASQEYMKQALSGTGVLDGWIVQQMESVGSMMMDIFAAGTTGAMSLPEGASTLQFMGTRAAGSAMLEAQQKGYSELEQVLVGVAAGSLEMLSEKLFGGNPLYDTDKGLVNKMVEAVTDNPTVLRLLYSKGFDIFGEGLEEVFTEVLDPIAEGLIANHGDIDWASEDEIIQAFLGGVFLSLLGKGTEVVVRNVSGEASAQRKAERELGKWIQNSDAVQELVAEGLEADRRSDAYWNAVRLQEKLDDGKTISLREIGKQILANQEAINSGKLVNREVETPADAPDGALHDPETGFYAIRTEKASDGSTNYQVVEVSEDGTIAERTRATPSLFEAKLSAEIEGMNIRHIGTNEALLAAVQGKTVEAEVEGIHWEGNVAQTNSLNGGTNNAEEQNSERGTDIGGDAERENGMDAEEGMGGQSTEWKAELQRRAGAASEVNDYVETIRSKNKLRDISTADLNVTGGVSTDHVGVIQYSDHNEGMRIIWERGDELGIDTVFVTNPMTVEVGGRTVRACGEHKKSRIIVQVNNQKMGMEQAADHEMYHVLADKDKELVSKTKEKLLGNYGDEAFEDMVRKYEEIYSEVYAAQEGMTEELVAERILEEMLADAYADYQRFENANARQFTETVREKAALIEEAAKKEAKNESRPMMTEEAVQSELKKEKPEEREYLDTIRKLQNQRDQGEITVEDYERKVLDYIEGEAGNQRVSEAYSRFSIEGYEEQLPDLLNEGIQQAATMEPVREMDGTEFAKGEKNLTDQVSEYFDSIGNRAVNPILGEVVLDKRGVKDDVAHGIGRKKAITFLAVPDVIEQGGMIDYQENWKGRGYDTAVLAAPVKIAGEDYMMGVVLNRYSEENDFYVHEVLAESDEGEPPFKTGTIKDGTPGGDTPSVISLLRKVLDVKKAASNTEGMEALSDFATEETEAGEVLDGDSLTDEIRHTAGGIESFLETLPKTARAALDKKIRAGAKLLADGMWTKNTDEFTKAMEEITNTYMELGTIPTKMEKQLFDTLYPLAAEHKGGKSVVRNNFRANIRQIMSELKEVRSYVKSKIERRNEKQKTVEEETTETIEKLWQTAKQQRKDYERVAAKYTLSDYDRVLIGQLLRGEISVRQIPRKNANKKAVIAVYEAKQLYEDTMRRLKIHKMIRNQELEDTARGCLLELENWKDTDKGWKLSINTLERNFDAAAPTQEIADKAKATYCQPIHKNEAKATAFKNAHREKIKALNLELSVRKGNKLSESAAVQLLGEAEGNIEYLQSRQKDEKREGKTLEEWQAVIANLWETNPNIDQQKIKNAVQGFREFYDIALPMMNEVRIRNGYEPVEYRKGYFPHFQNTEPDGILAAFGKMMGVSNEIKPLPTEINGLTKNFKPGIQWFSNTLHRTGTETVLGAVEGFDMYIEGVADVIYHTDDIQRLRALAREIRYLASDKGLKEQADEIKSRDIPLAEKEEKLEKLYQENKDGGRYQLSNFIWWLDEYTNQFANKRAEQDREMERKFGRSAYNAMNAWERRVAVNMVAINPSSWMTNFIPLTQAWGAVRTDYLMRGMANTIINDTKKLLHYETDGIVDRSAFLTNRRGSERLVKSWFGKASSVMTRPMNMIDEFVADSIVRARYIQNKKQKLSDEAALDEADAFAASVMADRSKGALPTIFNEKNPMTKLFTMFQVEQVNQFMYYFKDLPREAGKKNAAYVVYMLMKVFLGGWFYNELYEKLVGRRPAFDPIGMFKEAAQGIANGKNISEVVKDFGEETLEQTPFIGGLLGGGRLPVSSALPDVGNIVNAAFNESWSEEKKLNTLWNEAKDTLLYVAPPFGGGQIKKISELITAIKEHGSYNTSGELQYPVFTDDAKDMAVTLGKGIFFGKSSLEGAVEWAGSGFQSMSEKYTTAYQAMMELGETDRDAYNTVKAIKEAKAPEGESDEALKRQVLHDAEVAGDAKFAAYYELLASDKEKELMDRLDGEDPGTVYELLNKLKDISKTNEKREALMASGLSEMGRETVWKFLQGSSEDQVERAEELMDLAKETGLGIDDLMEMQMAGASFDLYERMTTSGMSGDAAYCAAMAIREAETENGPETDLKPTEKYKIILDNVSSAKEQAIAIGSLMQDSQRETFKALMDKGLTPNQYVKYKEVTDGITSDKDRDGKTIPGSKKEKIIKAINSLNISSELKTALYFAEGYSDSTLDEVPWDTSSSAYGLIWAGS